MKFYRLNTKSMVMTEVPFSEIQDLIVKDDPEPKRYAITYNINQYEIINRKRWTDYRSDTQEEILHKKVNAFARGCDSLVHMMTFEQCPKTGQRHLHATLESKQGISPRYVAHMNNKYKAHGYTTIDVSEIESEEAWERYLKKDQDKQ